MIHQYDLDLCFVYLETRVIVVSIRVDIPGAVNSLKSL